MNIRVAVIFNLLIFSFFSSNAQDKRANAILDAMSKKYKSLQSFSALFTYGADGNSSYKGDITTKSGKYRLKLAGQEVYNDGKTVATYVKETNEVNLSNYEPGEGDFNPAKIYTIYKKGYKYSLAEETKDGNAVIELVPQNKAAKIAKVRITVGKKDSAIKSWQITEKSGNKQSFRIDRFTPNVAVADNFFTFDKSKYPGVEVVDLRD